MAEQVTVTKDVTYQGVTLWLGDENPVSVDDEMRMIDLPDLIDAPLQRAVTIARLRTLADVLERAVFEDSLGIRATTLATHPGSTR